MSATWGVQYRDGTEDGQYNKSSKHFDPVGGEVPYRAIDWPNVACIIFESQWVRRSFDVNLIPEGHKLSLHSRHFLTRTGEETSCYLIAVTPEGGVPKTDCIAVTYWFPDDTMHECHLYDCPDVAQYGSSMVHGKDKHLKAFHGNVDIAVTAELAT